MLALIALLTLAACGRAAQPQISAAPAASTAVQSTVRPSTRPTLQPTTTPVRPTVATTQEPTITTPPVPIPTAPPTAIVAMPQQAVVTNGDAARPIAYVAGYEDTFHIFRMNTDGSDSSRITQHTAANGAPDWSPDGQRLAFHGREDRSIDAFDIYVMDADGANVTRLTRDPEYHMFPVWSPDGQRIAYLASGPYASMRLHLMDADGSDVVDTGVIIQDLFDWAPDGTRIVFSNGYDLFVMDTHTFTVAPLLSTPFDDIEPSWSPDGRHIAFVSGEVSMTNDGTQDIYMVDADGLHVTNITHSPANDRMPDWSPDGTQLVFLAMSPIRGLTQLHYWDPAIINRDGTGLTRLTELEKEQDAPVWRP